MDRTARQADQRGQSQVDVLAERLAVTAIGVWVGFLMALTVHASSHLI